MAVEEPCYCGWQFPMCKASSSICIRNFTIRKQPQKRH